MTQKKAFLKQLNQLLLKKKLVEISHKLHSGEDRFRKKVFEYKEELAGTLWGTLIDHGPCKLQRLALVLFVKDLELIESSIRKEKLNEKKGEEKQYDRKELFYFWETCLKEGLSQLYHLCPELTDLSIKVRDWEKDIILRESEEFLYYTTDPYKKPLERGVVELIRKVCEILRSYADTPILRINIEAPLGPWTFFEEILHHSKDLVVELSLNLKDLQNEETMESSDITFTNLRTLKVSNVQPFKNSHVNPFEKLKMPQLCSLSFESGTFDKQILESLKDLGAVSLEEFSLSGRERFLKQEDWALEGDIRYRANNIIKNYRLVLTSEEKFFKEMLSVLRSFPLKKICITSPVFMCPDIERVPERLSKYWHAMLSLANKSSARGFLQHLEVLDVPIESCETLNNILQVCPNLCKVQLYCLPGSLEDFLKMAYTLVGSVQVSQVVINSNIIFPWQLRYMTNRGIMSDQKVDMEKLQEEKNCTEYFVLFKRPEIWSTLGEAIAVLQRYGKKVFFQVDKSYQEALKTSFEYNLLEGQSRFKNPTLPAAFSKRYGPLNLWEPSEGVLVPDFIKGFFKKIERESF